MATLRDLVYDNQIFAHSNRDYRHHYTFNGDSGVLGNAGVKLDEAFYNVTYEHAHYSTPKIMSYNIHWDKPNEQYDDFYPIMCYTIDTDETNEYSFAGMNEVGENLWWGADWYCGNYGGNFDLRGYGQYFDIVNTDGYFDRNSNNAYHYYDINAGLITQGYDVIMRNSETLADWMGNAGVAKIPANLYGDPRGTNSPVWNAFYNVNNAAFVEGTPREINVDTNIPVLIYDRDYYVANASAIQSKVHSYLTDGDLTRFSTEIRDGNATFANNYVAPSVTEGTKQYNMYCDIYRGVWNEEAVENENLVGYKYIQIWVKPSITAPEPRVSLYKAGREREVIDGQSYISLKANIKVYGTIVQIRYSTDGGNTWTLEEATPNESLTLPWEELYYKRTIEKGKLVYDKNHGGNMLLFATEALADDGSPFLAEDYGDKSFYYDATNETGTAETSTEMATTYLASGFQRIYICDRNDIRAISAQLFDTQSGGIWEDIKKGVEMFGENPINAVAGLTFFPFDLTTCFRNWGTAGSIWFGGYQLQNVSVKELSNFNGYVDIGSIQILESFPNGDYRNYEPYCSLAIWLPFIGLQELKMNKYVGKTLSIRYYVDVLTGGCIACLFADGVLVDYFNGSMGVQLPISLSDYASFTASQIQNLTELGTSAIGAVGNVAMKNPVGVAEGVVNYEKSIFNLSQNALSNFNTTKGASTSMINQYLPNYVYVIFSIIETEETSNLMTLEGRRTNASGTVGSFSGFLQVESVKLNCSGATDAEKAKVEQMLASGIYI